MSPGCKPVVVSTSREPSRRTRSFVNDLVALAPWLIKANRGRATLKELVSSARSLGAPFLLIVCEKKANPSVIRLYDLLWPYEDSVLHAYTLFLKGVKLAKEGGCARFPPGQVESCELAVSEGVREDFADAANALSKIFCAKPWSGTWKPGVLYVVLGERGPFLEASFRALSESGISTCVGPTILLRGARLVRAPLKLL